jgi:hypothetical protein
MKSIGNRIGNSIKYCDFFSAPILLRYETEEDKKSIAGGCSSLLLIITLLIVFSNSWILLFKKTDIQSS